MRALNVLLAILVSLIIGVAVLEGGLRLIGLGPKQTLNQFDPVTGWSKKPKFELSRKHPDAPYKINFELNSLGLRDDEISQKKPDGVFRVITLGDSFSLGFGVNREDLFVDVLEHWWNAEGRRVEVINAGTEGYSTDQEIAWLEKVGTKLDPDLVLLFPYENDLYWNGRTEYTDKDKPRYDESGKLEARQFTEPPPPSAAENWALTSRLFGAPSPRPADSDFFRPPGSQRTVLKEWGALLVETPEFMQEPLKRTRGALLALRSTCAAVGAKAVVAPIPSHSAIDPAYRAKFGSKLLAGLDDSAWSPDKPVDTFLSLASELGLPTVDCRTTFKGRTDAGESLYYDIDWHLNEAGNHAFAQVLHDELDKLGVFPPDRAAPAGAPIEPESHAPRAAGGLSLVTIWLILWIVLTTMYTVTYSDEPKWQPPLKVGALLTAIFGILLGTRKLLAILPPLIGQVLLGLAILGLLIFVAYKLGRRLGTIAELFKAFTLRGHWYLMPLVVILLTIGSLLVVAASSPLIAPFIYTLF